MARFACAGCGAVAEQEDRACATCEADNWIFELELDDAATAEQSRPISVTQAWHDPIEVLRTLSTVRTALATYRQARSARRVLMRELSEYRTPAERRELQAILARYPGEQSSEIGRVLERQADATKLRCCTSPLPRRAGGLDDQSVGA